MVNLNAPPPVILLVEDDPGDQELTRRALSELPIRCDLRIVDNGADALDYLLHRGRFAEESQSPQPDLILLDLNLPRINGREVLGQLRALPTLKRIPVVILTTSDRDTDVNASYEKGCNSYITKPIALDRFVPIVRELSNYWFELVTLPN